MIPGTCKYTSVIKFRKKGVVEEKEKEKEILE